MTPVKTIHVVAAVILDGDSILCVQRGLHKYAYISQKWEFPGGKVEAGEAPEDAIKREILEELQMAIDVNSFLKTVYHEYPDFHLRMDAYLCSPSSGVDVRNLELTEHIDYAWLLSSSQEFKSLIWAAADLPIIEELLSMPR
jgi:8-oxo-dGTP diphosphatase